MRRCHRRGATEHSSSLSITKSGSFGGDDIVSGAEASGGFTIAGKGKTLTSGALTDNQTITISISIDGGAAQDYTATVSDVSGKNFQWSLDDTGISGLNPLDGSHTVTATIEGDNSQLTTSAGLGFTLDTASQTPTITLAASSDTGSSDSDGYTSDTTPKLTGTADAGSTVSIYDGATLLGTAKANGGGVWNFNANLADGTHDLTAVATDKVGNVSDPSSGLLVTVDDVNPSANAPVAEQTDDWTNANPEGAGNLIFGSDRGNAITVGDNNGDTLTVSLSVAHGTFTLSSTTGLTFLDGTVNGTGSMTFTGSAADINAALQDLDLRHDVHQQACGQ